MTEDGKLRSSSDRWTTYNTIVTTPCNAAQNLFNQDKNFCNRVWLRHQLRRQCDQQAGGTQTSRVAGATSKNLQQLEDVFNQPEEVASAGQ